MNRISSSYLKKITALGVPLLAGNLSHYLLLAADTAMVGHLGTAALGSIALAGMFSAILYVMVWPVSLGCQAIASRRFGRQQAVTERPAEDAAAGKTGEVLDNAVILGLTASILAFGLSFTARPILGFLVKDDSLVSGALSYINTVRWQLPMLGFISAASGFMAAINKTKPIMIANLGGNLLNILFNYLFIYGKFGLPALGIKGAALGTVLAEALTALFLLAVILASRDKKKYRSLHFQTLNLHLIKDMVSIALPPTIQNGMALLIFLAYEGIVGRLGIGYLAVTHIVFSMFRINKTIVGGFARSTSILVGNHLGREEKKEAVACIMNCEFLAALIGISIMLLTLVFPGSIVRIFTDDTSNLVLGIKALRFFAPFFFIEILGYSFEIIFTNNGWGKLVLVSEFSTNAVFILALSLVLTQVAHGGIYSAWLSFALYQVFHALILFIGFISKKWQQVEVESKR
ncbi:MAG: MATE family efflux transporter [Spirochaetales bacterium]|nr:MAG: MATE family efflux transporter [Spirochaetales bacterium]